MSRWFVGLLFAFAFVSGCSWENKVKKLNDDEFKTYYALRENGNRPLLPTYIPAVRPEERTAITALIVKEADAQNIQAALGGTWQPTGATLPPAPSQSWLKRLIAELREEDYTLTVYRRTPPEHQSFTASR